MCEAQEDSAAERMRGIEGGAPKSGALPGCLVPGSQQGPADTEDCPEEESLTDEARMKDCEEAHQVVGQPDVEPALGTWGLLAKPLQQHRAVQYPQQLLILLGMHLVLLDRDADNDAGDDAHLPGEDFAVQQLPVDSAAAVQMDVAAAAPVGCGEDQHVLQVWQLAGEVGLSLDDQTV